jgi:hypothetical protein
MNFIFFKNSSKLLNIKLKIIINKIKKNQKMKHSLFLLLFLFLFLLPNFTKSRTPLLKSFVKILKKYTTSDVVSLILECKTKHYKIIDPDDYLKKEDEIALEKHLKEIYTSHNVMTIIIMARNIDLTDKTGKKIDISNYTEIIYNDLITKDLIKNNSAVVISVVSIEGKIMTMKAHGSVAYTITQQDCYNILNLINNYYSYGEYSYGTVELGKLINYYLVNTGFFARNKRFFIMIIILILSFIICYILALIAQKIRERRNLRLTMSDEEKLLKIREFLKKCKADKKILSENCIICLEPFDNCTSINHSVVDDSNNKNINKDNNDNILIDEENKNNNKDKDSIVIEMQNMSNENINNKSNMTDNQISTLPCGHRYHVKCITEWMLRKKSICPMCREKMDVSISDNGEEEDLQNELLNIQIELHPAFALLVFQTINEELTWGAMAIPAIHGGLFAGLGGFAFI